MVHCHIATTVYMQLMAKYGYMYWATSLPENLRFGENTFWTGNKRVARENTFLGENPALWTETNLWQKNNGLGRNQLFVQKMHVL